MAWNETQEYLAQKKFVVSPELKERMPILKHWLDFFGAPGTAAYNQLADKIASVEAKNQPEPEKEPEVEMEDSQPKTTVEGAETTVAPEFVETEPSQDVVLEAEVGGEEKNVEEAQVEESAVSEASPEQEEVPATETPPEVFEIQKMERQIELLNQNQAWLAARCIQLKNIEVYAYPFYGFIVDLLRQTLKTIENLESKPEIEGLLDQYLDGGRQALENKKQAIQHEIELAEQNCESAATTLISEDMDMDTVRKTLGVIDNSNTVEYLDPAPDGFELLDDEAPLDESAIKEQYRKIENMDALTGRVEKGSSETEEEVKEDATEKKTSQKPQKGVQRKLSFSLKPKKSTTGAT